MLSEILQSFESHRQSSYRVSLPCMGDQQGEEGQAERRAQEKRVGAERGSLGDWLAVLHDAGRLAGLFSVKSRGAARTFDAQWFHSTHLCVPTTGGTGICSPCTETRNGRVIPCELLKPCYSPWLKPH